VILNPPPHCFAEIHAKNDNIIKTCFNDFGIFCKKLLTGANNFVLNVIFSTLGYILQPAVYSYCTNVEEFSLAAI